MAIFVLAIILLCVASGLALREFLLRRRAETRRSESLEREAAMRRLLRLAAADLRGLTLSLLGHAQTGRDTPDGAISGLGRRFLGLSDDLLEQTETPDARRHLVEEAIAVRPIVEFAVARVAAQLGPARRAWRISEGLRGLNLRADRRALNHILVNVLSSAASATRNGDWIDISCETAGTQWFLMVQDEGVGLPVPYESGRGQESRGVGLGLALARSLMHAHGGTLSVDSTAQVGTNVRLGFPASRLMAPEEGPAHRPAERWQRVASAFAEDSGENFVHRP